MPTKNMLTTKESAIVSDLLILESLAVKKCKIYSRALTNQKLTEILSELQKNHQKRFLRLHELLGE